MHTFVDGSSAARQCIRTGSAAECEGGACYPWDLLLAFQQRRSRIWRGSYNQGLWDSSGHT